MRIILTIACCMALMWVSSASAVEQLAYFSVDSTEGLVDAGAVSLDAGQSADGKGSLRIDAAGPVTVALFQTGDLDVENARLVYQAMLRSEDLQGQAYLEMWCDFAELGSYFSRALHAPISGSTEWQSQETPFFLQAGQNPENVRLNLVITGPGTVWVDDIRLLRVPLQ